MFTSNGYDMSQKASLAGQVASLTGGSEGIGRATALRLAYPNLEEAVRFGEDLLPLLQRRAVPQRELPLAGAS